MMGMTQEMVRDGKDPMSVHLLYSNDFEVFNDEFNPRMSSAVYLLFVLCRVVELGPVKRLHLYFSRPILPSQSNPMAPKRQFRGEVGLGGAAGVSLVKGNYVKHQTHQATHA